MLPFNIRLATEEDLSAVNALFQESFDLHHEALPDILKKSPKDAWSRGGFISELEDNDVQFYLAEKEGRAVGFIQISLEKGEDGRFYHPYTRISIDELSVTEKERGQGIGTALIKKAEEWARERGVTEFTTIAYDFNKTAIQFYEKNGYEPVSIRMSKKLD